MSNALHLAVSRRKRRIKSSAGLLPWGGWSIAVLISLAIALLLVWLVFALAKLTLGLPSLELLPNLLDAPDGLLLKPTQLFDRNEQQVILTLASPMVSEREYVKIAGIAPEEQPEKLMEATLASIDPTFWQNPGYSLAGLWEGSHPTLAQKLVNDFMLKDEKPGLSRNIRERMLAAQIIQKFGREKILEWYLNTAHYGPFIYGADAASLAFFRKNALDLTLAETAMLAAAAEAPGIHPFEAPQVVSERQQVILQAMFVQGRISNDEFLEATLEKIEFLPPIPPEDLSPAFSRLVLEQVKESIPEKEIAQGGYRIITTLNYDLQIQSSCAAQALLARLSGILSDSQSTSCPASRLLPTLSSIQGDIPTGTLAATLVAMDVKTGQVLSMIGADLPGLNPARLPGHSPGTLLTPIVYLTAFTRGFSPGSMIWDIPNQRKTTQSNADETEQRYYGPIRLRTALVNDYPGPSEQLFNQLGQENILRTVRQLGITSLDFLEQNTTGMEGLAGLIENRQITLLEAVQTYGIFANQGIATGWIDPGIESDQTNHIQPATIIRIEDSRGQALLDWSQPHSRPVLSKQLAYLMTHVLSDETSRWPSLGHPNPLEIGRPAAAKIGTTESRSVEWTIGYTPQMILGTWFGPAEGGRITLPNYVSAALWHANIQYAMQAYSAESWEVPAGITFLEVCDPSGLLPTSDCPAIVPEVFLNGLEPYQPDNLFQKIEINRETGRLATVFTPPELVTERVYLIIPSEAVEWAEQAGLPLPPDDYDAIYTPEDRFKDAQINEPMIFSHVHGQVIFRGKASGDDFQFYRLQAGKGLNPKEWLQIGLDFERPVENGILGTWDTQDLSGLYTIQLLVVHKDQRVERAVTQVTVDNIPPEVVILSPIDPTPISIEISNILIRAEAKDNLELDSVEFYINDRLVVVLDKPPFVYPWKPMAGKHQVRVKAIDLAGNEDEASLELEVK